jgi:polyphosphate glucokinase
MHVDLPELGVWMLVEARPTTRFGIDEWEQRAVAEPVTKLVAALQPDYVILGAGNTKRLGELPPKARLGGNDNAFVGAGRLWDG